MIWNIILRFISTGKITADCENVVDIMQRCTSTTNIK